MDRTSSITSSTAKPRAPRLHRGSRGIAPPKQQRSETQGKLERARQNLVRVRDVMDEVRRQLGSLERQARARRNSTGAADREARAAGWR
jgi:chromosome segregation protein